VVEAVVVEAVVVVRRAATAMREHGVGCDEAARNFLSVVGVCEPIMARHQALYSRKWAGK
jgi:hypothetical protein